MIETMPNELPDIRMVVENIVPLPRCCPVSGNPQAGSRLRLRYRPAARTLEVYSLRQEIDAYVDGHETGIRNMETMIQQLAQDCANAVGVAVTARAELVLHPHQEMVIVAWAKPEVTP